LPLSDCWQISTPASADLGYKSGMALRLPASTRPLLQWLTLGSVVGVVCGLASAAFLFLLDEATDFRERHSVLVYTLPLAGLAIGALYARWGQPIRGGNVPLQHTSRAPRGADTEPVP
jgi:H+/Cl- antiporter ClcA